MTDRSLRSIIFNRRMLICIFVGFSSGLPLFLLLNLVPAWLRGEGVDLKAIGLLTLIQLPYTWKFLWSPLIDRYTPLRLGRRRSWMLLSQLGLLVTIAWFGAISPVGLHAPGSDWASIAQFLMHPVTLVAIATATFSATQDIALDAYRRELLPDEELGLGNSVHVTAYRIAGLIPGSLSLILADHFSWLIVFGITALFMLPGLALTLIAAEPINAAAIAPKTLRTAAVEPLREFLQRAGWRHAAWILGFIFFYKLGDSLCTALATPFYLDMGYTRTEIGVIAKNAGLWCSVVGGLLGGVWMVKLGVARALWIFGFIQMFSILGFAWLATIAGNVDEVWRLAQLGVVVGLEAFGVGVGTAAFVAFIAAQTNPAYTATQLALFTSFIAMPRTMVNSTAGYLVETLGWTQFYLLCFALAVPGMLMLLKVAPWRSVER
jgi:MFS transporter, PAT family, beta-lactamase induction signal transducer AmpG